MEEKIYDRQVTKQSLAARVLDEQQIERHFTSADLEALYSLDPPDLAHRPIPMVPKDRLLADMLQRYSATTEFASFDGKLLNFIHFEPRGVAVYLSRA